MAPAHAPLTWSIASCSITIAPFISFCCDGESGGHSQFEPTARSIFKTTRNASSYSFSLPGGSGSRHSGHTSDTPFFRSSATHSVQNACPHGRLVGLVGGSRQIRHCSASNAFRESRRTFASTVAERTTALQKLLCPRAQWRWGGKGRGGR